jgi:hypothetical protein
MPLTVQFGSWAPDQADTPIQVPDNQGPMMVPLADCLNVYFSNGSYKSIASPAASSIDGNAIAPLNTQALNAFSYFDSVAQQETIFVGTPVGIQQLNANGTWSAINFVTSQTTGLIGAALAFKAGNFLNSNTLKGNVLTFSTGAVSGVVTGISFVAGSYYLSSSIVYNGLSVGKSGAIPPFGTLNTSNVSFGTLKAIEDATGAGSYFIVASATDPTQSAFNTITSNGVTQTSASALYSYNASLQQAVWNFGLPFGFAPGSTYTVLLA